MSAALVQVIAVDMPRGRGVEGDPVRIVKQFYSPDGLLIAEADPEVVLLLRDVDNELTSHYATTVGRLNIKERINNALRWLSWLK